MSIEDRGDGAMVDQPDNEPPDVASLREEIDDVERAAAKRIDPGRRAVTIAVGAFVLIVALLLPWVGGSAGWQVLLDGGDGALPRLFAATSVGFGVAATALALVARRWWLSWVCAIGCCVASVDGLLAIWSQQSSGASGLAGAGPGVGMVLAVLASFYLAASWMRVAWSRTQ